MVQLKKNGHSIFYLFIFYLCLNIKIHNDINITVDNIGLFYFLHISCVLSQWGGSSKLSVPSVQQVTHLLKFWMKSVLAIRQWSHSRHTAESFTAHAFQRANFKYSNLIF